MPSITNKEPIPSIICCEDHGKLYASDDLSAKDFNKSILSQLLGEISTNSNLTNRIRIVFHFLNNITEKYLFAQEMLAKNNKTPLYPILHILPIDIFSEKNGYILKQCPRYCKVIDSSIWNHIIILEGDTSVILDNFKKTLKAISSAYANGLYNLYISHEYADLNARLVGQSYLTQNKTSHGAFISPFLFHSEKQANNRLIEEGRLCIEKNKDLKNAKWRILLIDDHANKNLSEKKLITEGDNDEKQKIDDHTNKNLSEKELISEWDNDEKQKKELCKTGKLQLIINDLLSLEPHTKIVWCCPTSNEMACIEKGKSFEPSWNSIDQNGSWEKENFAIAIMCARSIHEAEVLIKYAKFDLILLDYLLGNTPKGREYSYQFLKNIDSDYKAIKQNKALKPDERHKKLSYIGPLGHLYFMYISAFVTAISERLQEQSLIRDTKYWHIGRGACPTNTPQLFLYYLYRLMEKRYSEMVLDEEEGIYGHTLIDLLYIIFVQDLRLIKGNAMKYFNTLLNLRRKYDLMKNDIYPDEFSNKDWLNRRGSLLVYSLFPDIQYYSNSFWEHIQQLIYLTAYGTIRQWPEMWEEYMFVRESIKSAECDVKIMFKERTKFTANMPSGQIEKYIIQLKNA